LEGKKQRAKSKEQENLAGFYSGAARIERSEICFLLFAFCLLPCSPTPKARCALKRIGRQKAKSKKQRARKAGWIL
jgi:hypothetical protein